MRCDVLISISIPTIWMNIVNLVSRSGRNFTYDPAFLRLESGISYLDCSDCQRTEMWLYYPGECWGMDLVCLDGSPDK
jgi:hypothetical protein